MKNFLYKYRSEVLSALIMLVICALAYVLFVRPKQNIQTTEENTEVIASLRKQLAESKLSKAANFSTYQDSMAVFYAMVNLLDTVPVTDISNHYDNKTKSRLDLSPDSLALLMRDRIRKEPQYAQRFDYNLSY